MSLHSVAATVISTAVVSAGATTVVNHMVARRWRQTRDRLGHHFGGPGGGGPDPDGPTREPAGGPGGTPVIEAEAAGLSEAELERRGGMAWRDGDYAAAGHYYELALAKAQSVGATGCEARALNNLGTTHDRLGEVEPARVCFTRAADLYRAAGDRHGEAEALTNLGLVLRRQGRHGQAAAELERALRRHRDVGDRYGEASVLSILGEISRTDGDLTAALATHRLALEIHRELSRADAEAASLNDCATTLLELDHAESALTAFANALAVARRVGADAEAARGHDGIATIRYSQGDRTGARTHWTLAWHLLHGTDIDRAEVVAARLRQLN